MIKRTTKELRASPACAARRRVLIGGTALGGLMLGGGRGALAQTDALASLVRAAEAEAEVISYDANPPDQDDRLRQAFNARYPRIRVRTQRMVGAVDAATRIMQESQAGAPTADIVTTGPDQVWQLAGRGLLSDVDWPALGISTELTPSSFAVATSSSLHLILYNTRLVPAAEAPRGWDDLVDPRWKGRIGLWVSATAFAHLSKIWGEEAGLRYVEKLAALQPVLFRSSFPMSQAVGAGEVAIACVNFHGAQPTVRAGAPVKLVVGDPAPVNTLYTALPRGGRSPAGARVLASWLASSEGARASEDATDRGIHKVHDTRTAALVRGRTIAEYAPEEIATYSRILATYSEVLRAGGRDAK